MGYIVRPFLKHITTRQNKTINKNIVSNKQTTVATKTKTEIQIIIRGKRNSHNTPQRQAGPTHTSQFLRASSCFTSVCTVATTQSSGLEVRFKEGSCSCWNQNYDFLPFCQEQCVILVTISHTEASV